MGSPEDLAAALEIVAVEPTLQPLSSEQLTRATANTQDGARLDVVANGPLGVEFVRESIL